MFCKRILAYKLSKLGLGTIWMGRRWPMDNDAWEMPNYGEVFNFLDLAHKNGIRMFDTAAAYGEAEERLGRFFKAFPAYKKNSFIATKWGEEFDLTLEKSTVDHSRRHLNYSLNRSLRFLPKVDLLYIHKADAQVLSSKEIFEEMQRLKKKRKILFTGVSISNPSIIKEVLAKNLLWTDYLQIGAWVAWEFEDMLKQIHELGVKIVVNAPARSKPKGMSFEAAYKALLEKPYISFVLTGTRNHLREVLSYNEGN